MFGYREPLFVVRIGKIANERPFRAPMSVTRNEARNATSFPTNKPTNISTNKSTNKPTFFNNVSEGVVRTQEEVAGQRDARRWPPRSKGRLLKNVGFFAQPGVEVFHGTSLPACKAAGEGGYNARLAGNFALSREPQHGGFSLPFACILASARILWKQFLSMQGGRGMNLHSCCSCDGRTALVLDVGRTAPSRRFLTPQMAHLPEPNFPLRLVRCDACGLLQLDEVPSFHDSAERSGPPATDAIALARHLVERYELRAKDLVIEIGDGPAFVAAFRTFGVPALSVSTVADLDRRHGGAAKVVLARTALARQADPNAFLKGLKRVLTEDGVAVLDLPHALPIVNHLAYDHIRHESRAYYSVEGLCVLMARNRLEVIDAVETPEIPGAVRITVQHEGGPLFARPAVDEIVGREQDAGINRPEAWADFAQLVEQSRDLLTSEIEDWSYRGKRIAGYSSGGHGMTLLAYCGLDSRRLSCLIDDNPQLHGRLTPGHRIPIVDPDQMEHERPDLLLWLAGEWSAAAAENLAGFHRRGGRVLVPLPKPHYVEPASRIADPRQRDTMLPGLSFSEFA